MNNKHPELADWVTTRAEWTPKGAFTALRVAAEENVKSRNAAAPAFEEDGHRFQCSREGDRVFRVLDRYGVPGRNAVEFTLLDGKVIVSRGKMTAIEAWPVLTHDGVRKFQMLERDEDCPLMPWQLLREALEHLFFEQR